MNGARAERSPLETETELHQAQAAATEPLLRPEALQAEDTDQDEQRDMSATQGKPGIGGSMDKAALGLIWGGLAIFVVGTWGLMLSSDLSAMKWFALHPPLQSVSILALVLGITPLQPPTPPTSSARQSRFHTHQSLILRLSLPCLLLATSAIWWNKHIRSATHFKTWHGWFGVLTVVGMTVQGGMGVVMAWYGSEVFGSEGKAKAMYKYHRLSGYILVGLMLFTSHIAGAYSHWTMRQGTPLLRVVIYWLAPLAILIGLGMRIQTSKMQFTPR